MLGKKRLTAKGAKIAKKPLTDCETVFDKERNLRR